MNNTIANDKRIFREKSFSERVGSMLKLDFYRLFHTPALFIFMAIAAIIPAMVLSMSGMETTAPDGTVQKGMEVANTWQMIESTGGSAVAENPMDFSAFANINMVFIFAGLLMAIFVAHDYSSGFVKNIFTVHSKKTDYVISKSAVGIFGGAGMIIAYFFGTAIAGLITGKSFDVNLSGLILCLMSKVFLMGVFCSLFLAVSVFFKNRLWLTIIFTFLFGMMLYPAASVATLASTITTVLLSLTAGVIGAFAIGIVSGIILRRRDLT
jgi:hypothetical protein